MGRMGPGHTLMAKCSCMEIFTGDGGGGAEGGDTDEGDGDVEDEDGGGRVR